MILLIEHRVVILTPPKTASDALHRLFCSGPPWSGLAVVQRHHDVLDKHGMEIPAEAAGFRVLLSVRHPLDRLVSLWHHRCRLHAYHGRGSCSFQEFATQVAGGRPLGWLWTTTIDELAGELQPDALLRCESLAADLKAAGLDVAEIPRVNESYRRSWPAYYTAELLQRLRPWADRDCQRFTYAWPP